MDSRFVTLQVRLPNVLFLAASLYVSVSGSEAPVVYTTEVPGADSTLHTRTPHAGVTSTPPQDGIEAGYPALLPTTAESPSKDGSQDSTKSNVARAGSAPSLAMTVKDTWILQSQTVTSKASVMTPSQTMTHLEAMTRDGQTIAAEDKTTLPSEILQATGEAPISPSMTAEDKTTLPSEILQVTGEAPISPSMTAEDETTLPSEILQATGDTLISPSMTADDETALLSEILQATVEAPISPSMTAEDEILPSEIIRTSAARDVGAQGPSRRSPRASTRARMDGEKPAHYTAMLHVALRACPRRVGPDDHIPVLLDQLCQLLRSRFLVEDFEVRWRPHESVHVLQSPDDELTHTVPHEELTANCRKPVESMGSQT